MENRAVLAEYPHIDNRGDLVKDKKYAAEYQMGNTRVKICDDYCCSCTKEEIELILKRIAKRALESFHAEVFNKV